MDVSRPTTIVVQTRVRPGADAAFAEWQARMSDLVADAPGFVAEHVTPAAPPQEPDWVIVQRFGSRELAHAWLASSARAEMLEEAEALLTGDDAITVLDGRPRDDAQAVAVIRSSVAPGAVARFRAWHERVEAAHRAAPGYVGCTLQEPVPGADPDWVTILAFDSREHLGAWLDSPRRAALVAEAGDLMRDTDVRLAGAGFAGWLRFPAAGAAPAAWKANYVVLACLYPIVMVQILLLHPLMLWMPLAVRALVDLVISVALVGWPLSVWLARGMGWWTAPAAPSARRDLAGALVMVAIIAAAFVLFLLVEDRIDISPITHL
jgi:antibiotic biosynthesis monooxygenase (ABM) superfamily enzyme